MYLYLSRVSILWVYIVVYLVWVMYLYCESCIYIVSRVSILWVVYLYCESCIYIVSRVLWVVYLYCESCSYFVSHASIFWVVYLVIIGHLSVLLIHRQVANCTARCIHCLQHIVFISDFIPCFVSLDPGLNLILFVARCSRLRWSVVHGYATVRGQGLSHRIAGFRSRVRRQGSYCRNL